jgi:catechol 2,3-dioxygenase-like lactoylglutathione lyase family enzyme
MAIRRMDNVLVVVDDLEAATAFFVELGMELEGKTHVQGRWVDQTVGLDGVRADIVMMRTPDGHGRVELTKFHAPPAVGRRPAQRAGEHAGHPSHHVRRRRHRRPRRPPAPARRRTPRRDRAVRGQPPALLRPRPRGIIVGLAEQLG